MKVYSRKNSCSVDSKTTEKKIAKTSKSKAISVVFWFEKNRPSRRKVEATVDFEFDFSFSFRLYLFGVKLKRKPNPFRSSNLKWKCNFPLQWCNWPPLRTCNLQLKYFLISVEFYKIIKINCHFGTLHGIIILIFVFFSAWLRSLYFSISFVTLQNLG